VSRVAAVLCTLILLGGDLRMFADRHAFIVIFGGSFAAMLIRFPLASIFHGLPLGAKFAFTRRRMNQCDLVDEIAGLAEIARKHGPIGLEKAEIDDPFLAPTVTTPPSSAIILNVTATTSSTISMQA
jgi:chemotaxis protein MotA